MEKYGYIPKLYDVKFEETESDKQSEEYFLATVEGERRRFNIHDYATLYSVPWLYDIALYHVLACRTPTELSAAIDRTWSEAGVDRSGLRVLELGAGSGAFGQELRELGVGRLEAIDIHPLAATAAERDRPGVYDAYHVDDLTNLSAATTSAFDAARFNVVGVASATGWGNHIPLTGFEKGFEILEPGGWFVFHVKPNDPDPECVELCSWIADKAASGEMDQKYRGSHFHRKRADGTSIHYDVVIGIKR